MDDSKRILVLGAGWYGCHIALELHKAGHVVLVADKASEIFSGAASMNQQRLHQGVHYLRSGKTRKETLEGFRLFLEAYPQFSREVKLNTYAVPESQSILDFETCSSIMKQEAISFEQIEESGIHWGVQVDGEIVCSERLILHKLAKQFFESNLSGAIALESKHSYSDLDNLLREWDFVIDATYGGFFPWEDVIFEATLLGKLSNLDLPVGAITLIDGPFWSIYPTSTPGEYSVSHVALSPLFQNRSREEVERYVANLDPEFIQARLRKISEEISSYIPNFRNEIASIEKLFVTVKLKPIGASAGRQLSFHHNGRFLSIRQGKVDAIFKASQHVLNWIANEVTDS